MLWISSRIDVIGFNKKKSYLSCCIVKIEIFYVFIIWFIWKYKKIIVFNIFIFF